MGVYGEEGRQAGGGNATLNCLLISGYKVSLTTKAYGGRYTAKLNR